mgnify:FL=1
MCIRDSFYTNYEVKIKEIHPRWNYVKGYRDWELDNTVKVFHHYTIPNQIQDEEVLDDPNINDTIGNFEVFR